MYNEYKREIRTPQTQLYKAQQCCMAVNRILPILMTSKKKPEV